MFYPMPCAGKDPGRQRNAWPGMAGRIFAKRVKIPPRGSWSFLWKGSFNFGWRGESGD